MPAATLHCDSGAAMVQAHHPGPDKSTKHRRAWEGTFVGGPPAQVKEHQTPPRLGRDVCRGPSGAGEP